MNNLIGVTIPCFKSKMTLKRALVSVLNQTFKNYVIFVVSDGDLESFEDVLYISDKRIVFFHNEQNIGRYAIDHLLCNYVLPKYKCKYWAPIDSDDYVEENYLQLLFTEIEKGYDVVFTNQIRHRSNGKIDFVKVKPRINEQKLFRSASILGLWDLEFVRKNNLTNPNYRVSWDVLMTSVAQLIGNFSIIEKPIYHIIKQLDSLSTSEETGQKSKYRKEVRQKTQKIWNKILVNPENTSEILRRELCIQSN